MSVRFETVKAGDVLYDVHSVGVGNTDMREQGVWEVRVKDVDTERRRALVSWNGNAPQWRPSHWVTKLRRNPPEWVQEWRGRRCYSCRAELPFADRLEKDRSKHHKPNCMHPKAVAYRKKRGA